MFENEKKEQEYQIRKELEESQKQLEMAEKELKRRKALEVKRQMAEDLDDARRRKAEREEAAKQEENRVRK